MSYTEKNKPKEAKPASTFKKVIQQEIVKEESVTLRVEEPKVRYLKLHEHCIPRLFDKPRFVPQLRLCGRWLEKAGFFISDYVSVTVMDGLLVIRSATPPPAELLPLADE